jgi:hypothetical protein
MKKREKGGNEKMLGGEMQKEKKRGKLELVVGHVYLMHATNWTRVKNTRGYLFFICNLPRCHQDTWLVGRVAIVTATVDTRLIA